mgnify:FL=1
MTNRLGDVRTIWIYGILAVLVLAGGLQGAGKIDIVTDWARLLPGFNQTIPEGTSIVGVNLATNDLMYFTGEKWRKIDIPKDNGGFVMGSYDFKPENMVLALSRFYFLSERRPSKLNLEINEWRYWEVVNGESKFSTVKINPHIKKIFIKNEKIPESNEYIDIDYANNRFYGKYSVSDIYTPFVAEIEYEKYPEKVAQVLAWRDSILEGEKCEKFLSLKVDEKKQGEKEKSYTVRKVDNYLFVDLSKSVYEGKSQEYDKLNCLGIVDYEDKEDRNKWENDADATIKYSFTYDPFAWVPFTDEIINEKVRFFAGTWSYSSLKDKDYVQYPSLASNILPYMHLNVDREFYEYIVGQIIPNLNSISASFNCDDKIIQGFFIKDKKISNFGKCNEWKNMKQEDIDKLIYDLLNEYNRYLLPPAPVNPNVGVP